MNLTQAIDIYAGGPGSGCHGPHCGRPSSGKAIEPGDTVKLKVPVTLWNKKTGNNDKFAAGQKAVVVNVMPKIGTADQMLKVNLVPPTKHHEAEEQHVKMSDVEMHQSGLTHQINPGDAPNQLPMYTDKSFHPTVPAWKLYDLQPVPPSQVLKSFKTADGAKVTIIKTNDTPEKSVKTLQEMATTPSSYKGKFQEVLGTTGGVNHFTRIYDTQPDSFAHERTGNGAVVYVHQYPQGRTVIEEQTYTKYSQKTSMTKFEYQAKPGKQAYGISNQAFKMLKQRYGISFKTRAGRF
jgi:hypothetical protein